LSHAHETFARGLVSKSSQKPYLEDTQTKIRHVGKFILIIDEIIADLSPVSEPKNESVALFQPTTIDQRQDDSISEPLQIQELVL
jgi:hypothetical protein